MKKESAQIIPLGDSVMEDNYKSVCSHNNNCLMVLSTDCNSNASAISQQSTECETNDDASKEDRVQWSLDYIRNRDDRHGRSHMHTSILSMCGPPQSTLLSYDDLSRNIDASLAEIDMETFRSADINSILALPTIYSASDEYQSERKGEQQASVSASMIGKNFIANISTIFLFFFTLYLICSSDNLTEESLMQEGQSSSSGGESAGVMSICKSEPLFSPVKEVVPFPANTVSVDSLDCQSFDDQQEIIMSCQANKGNYMIAFEGSYTHVSEDSDYHDTEPSGSENESATWSHTLNNLPNTNSTSSSMVQSDYLYTTWRKLRNGKEVPPTEENNSVAAQGGSTSKTRSLPNLCRRTSFTASNEATHTNQLLDSSGSGQCVRLFDIQGNPMTQSKASDASSQHSFSLVQLFVQSKTNSPESENYFGKPPVMKKCNDDNSELKIKPNQKVTNFAKHNLARYILDNGNNTEEDDSESFEDSLVDDQRPKQSKKPITTPISEEELGHNGIQSYDVYNQSQGTQTKNLSGNKNADLVMESSSCELCGSISKKSTQFPVKLNHLNITTMRTVGTQIPLSVCSRSVQTLADPEAEFKTSVIADLPTVYEVPAHKYTSQSSDNNGSPGEKKSIYICYPNYSLPDLSFLASSTQSLDKFLLKPTKHVAPVRRSRSSEGRENRNSRPKSFSDMDSLAKQRNRYKHIQDWDSLKFLLPAEYLEMIQEPRGLQWDSQGSHGSSHSSECQQCHMRMSNDTDVPPMLPVRNRLQLSSNESHSNQFVDDEDLPPPLPPKRSISLPGNGVPKSILRKNGSSCQVHLHRHSLNEPKNPEVKVSKRSSLQEPLGAVWENCFKMTSEQKNHFAKALKFVEELSELPELSYTSQSNPKKEDLPHSGCSNEIPYLHHKQGDGLIISGSTPDSVFTNSNRSSGQCSPERKRPSPSSSFQNYRGKKSVSFSENIRIKATCKGYESHENNDISLSKESFDEKYEEGAISPTRSNQFMGFNGESRQTFQDHKTEDKVVIDVKKLQEMSKGVITVADSLITYCSQLLNFKNELNTDVTKIIINDFCPRLYSLLSYGLLPNLKSMFGKATNSLWRVIEVSSPPTPATKALHDLVLHINSKESLNTGLKKFTSFTLGLLNIHSLDSWLTYLRLKETVLHDHYQSYSFMYLSTTITKNLYDKLLSVLQPMAALPFNFDLDVVSIYVEPNNPNGLFGNSMNSSKSDESLSSLLSQARELRKAISQTSRTFQNSRPLSQVDEGNQKDATVAARPKSFGYFTENAAPSKYEKYNQDFDMKVDSIDKFYSQKKEEVLQTDEERIKQVSNEESPDQNPNLNMKVDRKMKPPKSEPKVNKNNLKYAVPKESPAVEKNKSDEVKFSELKKKWEMLSDDTNQKKRNVTEKKKASKLPVVNPPSPTKLKTSMSASKLSRKSCIPLPKSISSPPPAQPKLSSNLPVPSKRSVNVNRQISCSTKISSPRRNV
ncbi:Iporin [Nymphon striatum]|nr:Iporin [Nymphon striatum]